MKLRKRTQNYIRESGDVMRAAKKPSFTFLRRSAKEVMSFRIIRKFLLIGVAIATAGLLIGYSAVAMYDRTGRFSVAIENPDVTFAITLSETEDFKNYSSRLVNDEQMNISNMCGDNIPEDIDSSDTGAHNGDNYMAYTFFCKNVGTASASLHYELSFNNVSNHVDECIRVRMYINGEYVDYAKEKPNEQGPETHYCDEVFAGKYSICYGYINNVLVGQITKFTVVIWVEGDDPDCTDSVINGKIKFDMTIEAKPVVNEEVEESEEIEEPEVLPDEQ